MDPLSAPVPAPADDAPGAAQGAAPPDPADEQRDDASALVGRHVAESIQTVLTAMILAFVFRAFFIEPFIIPTGSMAESLLGAHTAVVCSACGWDYAVGEAPAGARLRDAPMCPNCHQRADLQREPGIAKAGDRILVHKWPFVLAGWLGPRRWDVIVFRDPANPEENYIKRLVGLPGETVEIVDGDVYIDGQIARKPSTAQAALWFVVYDQRHVPSGVSAGDTPSPWVAESETPPPLGWSGLRERVVHYTGADALPRYIRFDPLHSRYYLRDGYGYNVDSPETLVGDVRLSAEIDWRAGEGELRWEITRDDAVFSLRLGHAGDVTLVRRSATKPDDAPDFTLTHQLAHALRGRRSGVRFAHVDYRVWVEIDGRVVLETSPAQYAPDLPALRRESRMSPVGLRIAAARFDGDLHGLRIDRDVHYTRTPVSSQRAAAGAPFELAADAYFVLGDNSPSSHDGREWYRLAPHLRREEADGRYQRGTVRADQIVGQAFFVYLPGLVPSDAVSGLRVPDFGRLRFIR